MNVASLCIRIFEKIFTSHGEILHLVEVGDIFYTILWYTMDSVNSQQICTGLPLIIMPNRFIIGKFWPISTQSRISPWLVNIFSKIRMHNEATFTCYPNPARKRRWRGGIAAALSRHYFFPCPLEFRNEIQRLAHVRRAASSTETSIFHIFRQNPRQ